MGRDPTAAVHVGDMIADDHRAGDGVKLGIMAVGEIPDATTVYATADWLGRLNQ